MIYFTIDENILKIEKCVFRIKSRHFLSDHKFKEIQRSSNYFCSKFTIPNSLRVVAQSVNILRSIVFQNTVYNFIFLHTIDIYLMSDCDYML